MTELAKAPTKVRVFILLMVLNSVSALGNEQGLWSGTWQASPVGESPNDAYQLNQSSVPKQIVGTIRYRMQISQGGSQIRLRLSNEYGKEPLVIKGVSVGFVDKEYNAQVGTVKVATFSGDKNISIPPGAPVLSDPINLSSKSLSDLLVSIYVSKGVKTICHQTRFSFKFIFVEKTDATSVEEFPETGGVCGGFLASPIVTAIDVLTEYPLQVIVTLGDSITDGGVNSTVTERGWPGVLSRRLEDKGVSVSNAGIRGNRLLETIPHMGVNALARLDRDVFAVPGVSHIIVLQGINDIGMSGKRGMFGDTQLVKPEELITAYLQIITRAHERGIKVIGATLLPFEGAFYYSIEKKKIREIINTWIRTSKAFDEVIDFDAVMRDPKNLSRLKSEYDSGDHLHPNADGYLAMGRAVKLAFFD